MNMRWSLNELYTSFESSEFKNDLQKLDELIENINIFTSSNFTNMDNAKEKIEEYLNRSTGLYLLSHKLMSYSHLTLSVEATNPTALRYVEKLEKKLSELTEVDVKFKKWLSNITNLDELIKTSSLISENSFYLQEILILNKYLLSENEELIISKLKSTGSGAWTRLQEFLSSTLIVDVTLNGEEKHLPLPVVRNLANDKNSEVRKAAYAAELKSYEKIENSSAAAINGIKGETITLCDLRGYKSPLEQVLIESRLDSETLDSMICAMKESLPIFRKYFKKKAELLGHNSGLPFYDLFAPVGNADLNFTYEEAKEFIINNFKSFSYKLANFAKEAFEKNWIDAEPREGKRGGAFCSKLPSIKESRILSNFSGSFSDVSTLAHELGHGYHNSCLFHESVFNISVPMPLAETASIFNETIIAHAAIKTATKDQAFTILENDIQGSAQVIVDILSRYIFESKLFELRKESSLSAKELNDIMLNAQRQTYGDGLDENYLHPSMWVCKPHYYYADANFYNFPYAFGLLFGKGLFAEYLKSSEAFVKQYDNLLSVSGKKNILDVAAMMNIDLHSIDFWRSSLKLIEEDIEKFISLC